MKPKSITLQTLALVFAAAGLVVSLVAAYTHYRMLADVGYVSFCDVSATVSCTQVYSSRFGTFAGIPVAVFGAIWFAFATLLAIAGFVARPDVRESVPGTFSRDRRSPSQSCYTWATHRWLFWGSYAWCASRRMSP